MNDILHLSRKWQALPPPQQVTQQRNSILQKYKNNLVMLVDLYFPS